MSPEHGNFNNLARIVDAYLATRNGNPIDPELFPGLRVQIERAQRIPQSIFEDSFLDQLTTLRGIRATLFEQARTVYEQADFAKGDDIIEKMKQTNDESDKLLEIFFNKAKSYLSEQELIR